MDQQAVKLLPKVEASKAYYMQKLQMHNYTIYDLSNKDAYNFRYSEDNGNLEASSSSMLLDFLEKNISIKKKIFLISDGCGYQNRCNLVKCIVKICHQEKGKYQLQS